MLSFISKNALALALFAAGTTFFTALVVQLTESRIAENITKSRLNKLNEVLPSAYFDNDILDSVVDIKPHKLLGQKKTAQAYMALKNQKPSAVILPVVAPDGYNGKINLLVGISWAGVVTGVRVIPPHQETPGLGDAIEVKKSDWILSFDGKSLRKPTAERWAVKKDGGIFDQFTGATITPRAVVKAVKNSLEFFEQDKQRIYKQFISSTVEPVSEIR